MHKTFLELEEQYRSGLQELKSTLEKLAYYCSDLSNGGVEFEGIDCINSPFRIGYDESYFAHCIDGDRLHLNLEYKDGYDEACDSDSHMTYPLHWVEHAYNDTLNEIEDEVKSQILEHHYRESTRGLENAIHLAKHHNLISEEEAERRFAEISGKN